MKIACRTHGLGRGRRWFLWIFLSFLCACLANRGWSSWSKQREMVKKNLSAKKQKKWLLLRSWLRKHVTNNPAAPSHGEMQA